MVANKRQKKQHNSQYPKTAKIKAKPLHSPWLPNVEPLKAVGKPLVRVEDEEIEWDVKAGSWAPWLFQ